MWIFALGIVGVLVYMGLTCDHMLIYLTKSDEDWLFGFENVREIDIPDRGFSGSIKAAGIGIARIDFLTHNREE